MKNDIFITNDQQYSGDYRYLTFNDGVVVEIDTNRHIISRIRGEETDQHIKLANTYI